MSSAAKQISQRNCRNNMVGRAFCLQWPREIAKTLNMWPVAVPIVSLQELTNIYVKQMIPERSGRQMTRGVSGCILFSNQIKNISF